MAVFWGTVGLLAGFAAVIALCASVGFATDLEWQSAAICSWIALGGAVFSALALVTAVELEE